jgi:cytochrome d ubiquinol oxidase subunit II
VAPDVFLLLAIALGVTLYALFAGADFGAGIWQALLGPQASERERRQVHDAVGPVWEANHVWLIFVVVLLFTAFPPAIAAVARALWVPLLLALAGIVLRGAGFAFRPREPARRGERRAWDRVFSGASLAAPLFLGASLGAVAEGHLRVTATGGFEGRSFDWLTPLSAYVGVLAVGLCAHLAAVYLVRESALAGAKDLESIWRRRALASGTVVGALAAGGIAVVAATAPDLASAMREKAWPFVLVSMGAGLAGIGLLLRRRPTLSAAAAALAVAAVLGGWFAARWPWLVPPAIRADEAAAPRPVLSAAAWSTAIGIVLVAPSMFALLRVFKSARGARPRGRDAAGADAN